MTLEIRQDWICPNLRPYWQLGKVPNTNQLILCSPWSQIQCSVSPIEAHILRYFTGQFTLEQVQQQCQQIFNNISPTLVTEFIQNLVDCQILSLDAVEP